MTLSYAQAQATGGSTNSHAASPVQHALLNPPSAAKTEGEQASAIASAQSSPAFEAFAPPGFLRVLHDYCVQASQASVYHELIAVLQPQAKDAALPTTPAWAAIDSLPALLQCPTLGLELGLALKPEHLGPAGQVLIHCTSLGDAVQRLGRYAYFWGDLGRSCISQQQGWAYDSLEWPRHAPCPQPPALLEQVWAAATVSLARELARNPNLVWQAEFRFAAPPPAQRQAYTDFFGCSPRFGAASTQLVFAAHYLQLPIRMGNLALRELAQSQADALLQQQAQQSYKLTTAIRAYFAASLERHAEAGETFAAAPNHAAVFLQETVAQGLGLSTRTLHRRLAQQGLQFRQILDSWRYEQAQLFLQQPDWALGEIAARLGYAEQSNFQHAFKRWSGISPGAFRAQMLAHSQMPSDSPS